MKRLIIIAILLAAVNVQAMCFIPMAPYDNSAYAQAQYNRELQYYNECLAREAQSRQFDADMNRYRQNSGSKYDAMAKGFRELNQQLSNPPAHSNRGCFINTLTE